MENLNEVIRLVKYVPCNTKNYGGARDSSSIKYLVFHYTGNDGDNDTNNANYYANHVVEASAHYFVDDDSITQSVLDNEIAWAVGGKKWADCDKTGGGKLYKTVTNANSISIELCDTKKDGTYSATEETLKTAIALARILMQKYNIPIENVVRHFDVTGKHCPAYFMDETKWKVFKERIVMDDIENVTPEQAYKLYQKATAYMETLGLPTNWNAKEELDEAVALKITDGKNPMISTPRYQTAIMIKRAYKKAVKDILSTLK